MRDRNKKLHALFFEGGASMNRLREVRVVKRVTQFQLRLETGIHQSKISLLENGLMQPRDDEKKRLSKALGATPQELFPSD